MDATDSPILGDDDLLKQIEQKAEEPIVATAVDEKTFGNSNETHDEDDFEFGDFTEAGSSGEDETEYLSHGPIDGTETDPTDTGVLADELRAYQSLLEHPGGRAAFVDKVQGAREVCLSVDTSKLCTLDSLEREDAYGSLLRLREAPVSARQGYGVESVFRQRLVNKLHLNSNAVTRSNNNTNPDTDTVPPHTDSAIAAEEEAEKQGNHDTSQHAV
ncbi:hypothetical protein M9435_000657 [Picochlorum sp. BPE23]|nr:hypothetical protein M9435_000657 [Picochlorum sp. BPE23]